MNLEVFKNNEFGEVRALLKNGDPWFVGKDVATALGFKNSRNAIKTHVFDSDKGVDTIYTPGGNQQMTIINESGMYALIFGSRLKEASKFKRWVTSEVLPAIRKHGAYMTEDVLQKSIADPGFAIGLLQNLQEEQNKNKQLLTENKIKDQQIAELKPKAGYYDVILSSTDSWAISIIAKDYGMSPQRMNKLLKDLKVQYKQGNAWLLYQKHATHGYTETTTIPYKKQDGTFGATPQMRWTQKGRLFIYDLLKAEGILPLIEMEVENEGIL